ncbi:c-type cytochrome [Loktanella sp. R86503]|uniref:c-type cytochrome n=1 Tax=Loktanella TaxID=245186 RepID=UPI0036DEA62B
MMKLTTFALAMTTLAAPAFAESHMAAPTGDVASGEEQFGRQCVACHVVQDPESGEVLAGRNAKVGPNLFGLAGKAPAHVEGFNYGDALVAYGETGAVWNEETFVGYVQNPTAFLRDALDDKRARSKMAYQVRDAGQAADLYAYLASFGPAE